MLYNLWLRKLLLCRARFLHKDYQRSFINKNWKHPNGPILENFPLHMYNRKLRNDIFKAQHRKTLYKVQWEKSNILKYPRPHKVCAWGVWTCLVNCNASCARQERFQPWRDGQGQLDISEGVVVLEGKWQSTPGHLCDHMCPLVPFLYGTGSVLKGDSAFSREWSQGTRHLGGPEDNERGCGCEGHYEMKSTQGQQRENRTASQEERELRADGDQIRDKERPERGHQNIPKAKLGIEWNHYGYVC